MRFLPLMSRRFAALGTSLALAVGGAFVANAQTPPPPADAAPAPKLDPSTVLAKVNGQDITAGDVDMAGEDVGQSTASMPEPQRREYALNYLIDLKLAAQAAEKEKVADSDDFKKRLAYLKDRAMMEQLLQKAAKDALTDERLHKLYDDTAKNLKPEEEVHARHILVKTEDEAKKVEERLAKGEDFAKVAADVSIDPGSKSRGGDLGFFARGQMVPEFEDVAFKLEKDKVSDPVKTQFGYHVIKVDEKRTKPIPPFDQVRPQIENYVVRTSQQDLILKLRNDAKVERTEAGKAPPTPPAGVPGMPGGAGGAGDPGDPGAAPDAPK